QASDRVDLKQSARGRKQEVEPSCNARVTLGGKHLVSLPVGCRDDTAAGAPQFRILRTSPPFVCIVGHSSLTRLRKSGPSHARLQRCFGRSWAISDLGRNKCAQR